MRLRRLRVKKGIYLGAIKDLNRASLLKFFKNYAIFSGPVRDG
ncbi:hypothetical protein ETAE_3239 [Edwardsiella piscicida]|uniref:Uncharacterized protein n=1 Tax=Edwardsiella piscicida TaxID=1263550 RepID=A0AAU8PTY2_EDWPI|nr:hypothetical protein ETAE_3239 [Edwardsiella tarda EIB202]